MSNYSQNRPKHQSISSWQAAETAISHLPGKNQNQTTPQHPAGGPSFIQRQGEAGLGLPVTEARVTSQLLPQHKQEHFSASDHQLGPAANPCCFPNKRAVSVSFYTVATLRLLRPTCHILYKHDAVKMGNSGFCPCTRSFASQLPAGRDSPWDLWPSTLRDLRPSCQNTQHLETKTRGRAQFTLQMFDSRRIVSPVVTGGQPDQLTTMQHKVTVQGQITAWSSHNPAGLSQTVQGQITAWSSHNPAGLCRLWSQGGQPDQLTTMQHKQCRARSGPGRAIIQQDCVACGHRAASLIS
ncbi:hypothetical protein RRG08_034135 [Elysia crispata]|uniref:Uncharacterized protein n=1 Tax=Elysia crispata TaxID=231223 RepID=A0AAE1DHP7_9GAST|nr:hypothetical protein RRG08_034135 [Elysia crispata]